ncbi:glycohydrolase toxin TNT-related protein, partial [Microbacterium sp. BWT-B31]|uniref:glycohydrolase toxin TNT-related protein n=1 Tax=Microbacterium sp. BWT-B31 TaxID=3232072 RepID=UPI0035286A1F
THAMNLLDDFGTDLNTVTVHVDAAGNNVFDFPGGRIETPAGSFDAAAGIRTGGEGTDAAISAPVREPELVTAGGAHAESGAGAVNTIVDEAPVRTETSGSGETTVVRDPDTGGAAESGTGGSGHSPASGSTADSRASGAADDAPAPADPGDGWTSGPAHRGDQIDAGYGEPRPDHGTLPDRYAPPTEVPADIRHLVTDPDAPYGRGSDGQPYTRAEWEERYMGPDDRPVYPGNDGAAPGTRVTYTDMSAFRSEFGTTVDRFGGSGGSYLSPEGVPFEHRALPGGNLNAGYHVFRTVDELPPGVRIEVSEVAPAFGQPGGGVQIQFVHETDGVLSVEQLLSNDYRVLEPTVPTPNPDLDAGATTLSELRSPIPGSADVSALHFGSVPADIQRAIIRHEYPGMLGINATRFLDNGAGFDVNCTRCVIAFDQLMDGAPSSAMPVHTNGAPITDITRSLGLSESFKIVPDYASIAQTMGTLPEGSRAIVLIERPTGIGHVFNVIHDRNGVVFLDAQSGQFATLENAARLRLLITHTGTP